MYGYSGRDRKSYSKKKKNKKVKSQQKFSSFGYGHLTLSSLYGVMDAASADDIHTIAEQVFNARYYFLASDL